MELKWPSKNVCLVQGVGGGGGVTSIDSIHSFPTGVKNFHFRLGSRILAGEFQC